MGLVASSAGLAAFLVRLQHAGPYGIPGRGLVGGLLCFAIAGVLLARGAPTPARAVALLASPRSSMPGETFGEGGAVL